MTDRTLSSFNARLKLCRKAAGFILRMFQLHVRRSSAVGSIFKLVRFESVKARGDRSIYRLHPRASNADSFSIKSLPKIPSRTPPGPQSFLIHS